MRIAPGLMLPQVEGHVISVLEKSSLRQATQHEVNIMNWPEGELYDKSVIEG